MGAGWWDALIYMQVESTFELMAMVFGINGLNNEGAFGWTRGKHLWKILGDLAWLVAGKSLKLDYVYVGHFLGRE